MQPSVGSEGALAASVAASEVELQTRFLQQESLGSGMYSQPGSISDSSSWGNSHRGCGNVTKKKESKIKFKTYAELKLNLAVIPVMIKPLRFSGWQTEL